MSPQAYSQRAERKWKSENGDRSARAVAGRLNAGGVQHFSLAREGGASQKRKKISTVGAAHVKGLGVLVSEPPRFAAVLRQRHSRSRHQRSRLRHPRRSSAHHRHGLHTRRSPRPRNQPALARWHSDDPRQVEELKPPTVEQSKPRESPLPARWAS